MKHILLLVIAVLGFIPVYPWHCSYRFRDTPVSQALVQLGKDNPELNISFIYKELDNYRTSVRVDAGDAYSAIRQIIGLNPVSVVEKDGAFYIEALQHGRYVYTGHVVSAANEPIASATILLLAPKDSAVVTYGFTDDSGNFSIPCDYRKVVAKFSCLGYKPLFRYCTGNSLGTIAMEELPIQLKTVVVEADNATLFTDKSIYRPTLRQKNASQTAVDLLRNLAIPQITVNLVDESVTTLSGEPVAVYVDGLPASPQELQGMRIADVRRVEYLDFPTDARYAGNDHVINFVMQKYEYGGYTKLSASENILIGLSSRASLYSKFSYKKMIYDLYAGSSNYDLHHAGTSRISRYNLIDEEGQEKIVTRSEAFDKSHFKYNQYPVSFRAVYDSDNTQIGNTVGINFDSSPVAETNGTLTYSPSIFESYRYINRQPYTTRHLVWSGAYYFVLPNDFQLSFTPKVSYGNTGYTYSYSIERNASADIENTSKEHYSNVSGGASLYKRFSGIHSAFTNIYGGTNHNKVRYYGSSPYDNDFSDSFAGFRAGYSFNNRRWRFDSNLAMQWERNCINGEAVSEIYPLVNVSGSYSPSTHHSLQAFFHYGANYPGESVKSPNVLQDNELMYKTGNPGLSFSRQITFNFQYNWVANNNFSLSLFSRYFGEYGLYVPVFVHYNGGMALLRTYSSNQDYNRTKLGTSFNLKMLEGSLQFAAQPSVTLFSYKGYYNLSKKPFTLNSSLTYYLNSFFFQASFQTAATTINGNMGVYYRNRSYYQVEAGWGNADWNIRLTAANLFRGDWLAGTQTLESPLYSETMRQGGTYYHRRINLSVTYTFGYGKKVKRSNEVGEQSAAPSAILK
ncbi:MAG: TonB-dependent receptor family protein [Paramuribaculum sp.]|nr:TonB-dependent receptor family protein [Paramuribaculum sp.]